MYIYTYFYIYVLYTHTPRENNNISTKYRLNSNFLQLFWKNGGGRKLKVVSIKEFKSSFSIN